MKIRSDFDVGSASEQRSRLIQLENLIKDLQKVSSVNTFDELLKNAIEQNQKTKPDSHVKNGFPVVT